MRPACRIVLVAFCLALLPAGTGRADIWECRDAAGKKRYTNVDPARPRYQCPVPGNPRLLEPTLQGGPGCTPAPARPASQCRLLEFASGVQSRTAGSGPTSPRVAAFRNNLKVGDHTAIGLVIDVKPPIARVQTAAGERWFRIDELAPD